MVATSFPGLFPSSWYEMRSVAVVERLICGVKRTSDVMDSIPSIVAACLVGSLLSLDLRVDR